MKKTKKKWLFLIILVPFLMMAGFAACLGIYAKSPIDAQNSQTIQVDIPTGSSFLKITNILTDAGLVKNKLFFYCLASIKRATRSIRAGEYELSTAHSPLEMINKLLRGEIKYYRVTIHEDYTMREIAARLKEYKLINEDDFFELVHDEMFLSLLGVQADSLEGYLYPDTYYLTRTMSTRHILRAMVERFWNKITADMINLAAEKGLDPHQLVTFASLVGKETGYSAEKPMIAAVFYNRLRKKMPLQSDPTTVYDLKNFNGIILRSHYRRESPYNTYIIRGLPPGPISNPGLDSFWAVLKPADVDYLYFVSKKDGTHFFSSTFDEHTRAIADIRQNRKNNISATTE